MEFRILGPLEAIDPDGRRIDLGARRQRAVLAVLLVHVGEVVSIDRLIDDLWGEVPPNAATASLQAYVSNLRRVLEPERRPREPARVLVTEPPGYLLSVPTESVDAVRFDHLAADARRALAAGEATHAIRLLDAALALWRGDALAEFAYDAFAANEIARLSELRIAAEEDRLDARLIAGDHAGAVAALDRLVAVHPLRERLRGLQMRALYRSGRQVEALRAYEDARRVLADELGLDPSRELQALHRQVLTQDPALDAPVSVPRPSTGTPRAKATRRPLFVGREKAMTALDDAVDDAASGTPRIVLVEGEAGIGKTRLVAELSSRAGEAGHLVAWGRGHEDEGAPPLWPWVQVLRGLDVARRDQPTHLRSVLATLLPELGPAPDDGLDGDDARFRLFDAVRTVIERQARTSTTVIVLDDLHCVDASSLLLLRFLAVELHDCRVVIIGTFRDTPTTATGPLSVALGELAGRPGTERLVLSGLSRNAVAELVRATTSAADADVDTIAAAVHERTNGNAFFVTELLRLMESEGSLIPASGTTDVPQLVSDVVRRRIGRLPDDAQTVLGVASVIGRQFDLDVLAVACGLDVDRTLDALEPALATRILTEVAPGRFGFAHALVTETLYFDLNPARRGRLHGRVAGAIEATYGSDLVPRYSELAHHYGLAPTATTERAVTFGRRAAEQATTRAAFDEAVEHWRRVRSALDRTGSTPLETRVHTLVELAAALRRSGQLARGVETLDDAMEVAERTGDATLVADVALAYGEIGLWQVRHYGTVDERLVGVLSRALEVVDPDDATRQARLLSGLAIALYYRESERERSLDLTRQAIAIARRLGDRRLLAANLVELLVMLDAVPDETEQVATAAELASIDPAEIAPETASTVGARLLRVALSVGDASRLDAGVERAVREAARVRQPNERVWASWASSTVAFLRGRLDDAERLAGEAFALHQRLGIWGGPETYALHMVLVWREQGRLADVAPLVEPLLAEAVHPGAAKLRALFAIERDSIDEIAGILGPDPVPRRRDFTWLAETAVTAEAVAAARLPSAADVYDMLLPFAHRVVTMDATFVCLGSTAAYLGLLAHALGHHDEAAAHLTRAVSVNDAIGAVPWSVRSRYHLARLVARRDRSLAGAVTRQALDDAETHGLVAMAARLRQLPR